MLSRFKIVSLFLISLFLVAMTLFWGTVLSKFVEFSLRSYCKDCLSVTLKEENIIHDKQFIVFENLKLGDGSKSDEFHIIADQLVIYYEPQFLKRELDLYITLVNPTIDLKLIAPFISDILDNKTLAPSFFKINHQLQVKNGTLKFPEQGNSLNEFHEIHFSSNHDFIHDNELTLNLSVNSLDEEKNSMSGC